LSPTTIVILEGDQTGQELLGEALRVLDRSVIDVELATERFDLSLENRRATNNAVVQDAAEAMKRAHFGLKAATITPEEKDDVGSPNAILRKAVGGKVIVRTGRRLPRIRPVAGVHAPISVVRMAVGDAYGAKEWREGEGSSEVAYRTESIDRSVCQVVAEYAFVHAARMHAKVFGGPKFTVSPIYEGMFKEEMDAAAARHPQVPYDPQLIDATYALLLNTDGEMPLVIPSLNRDGDCLSDLVMQLFGSIAGAESVLLAFEEGLKPSVVMTEAPHGTAPRLFGKNVANPMAMILAAGALLSYMEDKRAQNASRAIYESALEAVHEGIATSDLGGHASTTDFTDAVIDRVKRKLDVWSSL
jgi:isocitrate/isopropylmalate dehydrogenase